MKCTAFVVALLIASPVLAAEPITTVPPGFIPPSTVPTFNNLGGTLSGVQTGTTFAIGQVQTVPIFHGIGNTELLGMKARDIINSAKPVP